MPTLHIDFETRGVLDLREVGLYRYAHDLGTSPWCMAWAIDEEPQLWTPGGVLPMQVCAHVESGGAVIAHNAVFELAIWNSICVPRYGWPGLTMQQTHCTMAQAYAMGLPGALEDAALALGLAVLKDAEGRALMLRMARPRSRDPLVWWDEPDKLARLYAYCKQDVRVERALHERLMPLSDRERMIWEMDCVINQRGVCIDAETTAAAVKMAAAVQESCGERLSKLTNGAVQAATALPALKQWMMWQGVTVESLDKQSVVDLLEGELPDSVREVLTVRQDGGKASVAKFDVMLAQKDEYDRLRNLYQYHGAATGRWAGRGVQVHNLIRDMPKPEVVERILALVRAGDIEAIDMMYGTPLAAVSRCTRSLFVAAPGKALVGGDFANIEGRGQAWFAGEEWKLKAFVAADNGTGPGLYELAYSRMFGVPVESVKNPSEERQVGKVCELAFGYAGGVGSFRAMSKNYGVKVPDATADEFKLAWRATHPKIVATWRAIENAAIAAVRTPETIYECGYPGRQAKFKMSGSFLWCLLPSERAICFPYPKLLDGKYGQQLTYMTVPSQSDKTKGKIIHDTSNSHNWARVSTYGGSLFNNIVQGFCRDLLAEAMFSLPVVIHTHDDIVLEVDRDRAEEAKDLLEIAMRRVPPWAAGLPLKADCSIMQRYGK